MERQHLIVLIGNIGDGKSTYIKNYLKKYNLKNYLTVDMDPLLIALQGEYRLDAKIESVCLDIMEEAVRSGLRKGYSVVVDYTNLRHTERETWREGLDEIFLKVTYMVFPDIGEDKHVERRMNHNCRISDRTGRSSYVCLQQCYEELSGCECHEIIYIDEDELV